MQKTWVVVAESSRARFFSVVNRISPLEEIEDMVNAGSRAHDIELTSDLPGRTFDSNGEGRHAMEPSTDPKKHEMLVFAQRVAEKIEAARKVGDFEEVVLISSPEFLGLLRQSISDTTKKHVSKSINKNLVQKTEAEIREYLF